MKEYKHISGPPGSRKVEISKLIAKRYDGFVCFSMGDLLRKKVEANEDDQLWQRIGKKMDAGEPVPTVPIQMFHFAGTN